MKKIRNIRQPIIKLGRLRKMTNRLPYIGSGSLRILNSLSPRSQRVVIKVKQSYRNQLGSWRAHGRYLERDTARSGDGFSKSDDSVPIAKLLHEWQKQGDEKLHKIIFSPEYSERINLKVHTRELMATMEKDLGRSIQWVAIVHDNTDNRHVHVSLRGVDQTGRALDVESYLGNSLRERSQEQITRALGPRLYPEILQRREKELFARRLTDIDRTLLWKADSHSIVRIPETLTPDWRRNNSREQERLRIAFLSALGLAVRISGDSWKLSINFRENLKQLGLREQIINDQVPGWEFVRTLKNSGVVRKQLALGECVTGRLIGTGIKDPFGDRRFMLLEGTDGVVYHINEPRGVATDKIHADQVVTLTRRIAAIRDEKSNTLEHREFTAIEVHPEWKKSLTLDYQAAGIMRGSMLQKVESNRIGFAAQWNDAVAERIETLRLRNFNSQGPSWKGDLEVLRFAEIDPRARLWSPREYSDLEGSRKASDPNRLLVGPVQSVSEHRLLVRDIRSGVTWIVSLKDIGLEWPPSVGVMVRLEVKPLPHVELRPSDERIASLLTNHGEIKETLLSGDEKKFVLARIRTWVRWEFLRETEPGLFKPTDVANSKSKEQVLERMETKLGEMKSKLTEEARRQPAWMKTLDETELSRPEQRFGPLESLLRDVGRLPDDSKANWLVNLLRERAEVWRQRGVALDRSFERNAKSWLSSDEAKSVFNELFKDRSKDRGSEKTLE